MPPDPGPAARARRRPWDRATAPGDPCAGVHPSRTPRAPWPPMRRYEGTDACADHRPRRLDSVDAACRTCRDLWTHRVEISRETDLHRLQYFNNRDHVSADHVANWVVPIRLSSSPRGGAGADHVIDVSAQ